MSCSFHFLRKTPNSSRKFQNPPASLPASHTQIQDLHAGCGAVGGHLDRVRIHFHFTVPSLLLLPPKDTHTHTLRAEIAQTKPKLKIPDGIEQKVQVGGRGSQGAESCREILAGLPLAPKSARFTPTALTVVLFWGWFPWFTYG